MGIRMGDEAQRTPKPMIRIGNQPILWHIMKWYASWGHTEFILCLGFRPEVIKEYFLEYSEALGNDFVLAGRTVELLASDMDDWRITFIDTGVQASIADRLLATRRHIGDDEMFLCTYGDGLTDAPLDEMIEHFALTDKTGMFMSVRPRLSYHVVDADEDGSILSIDPMDVANVRINGGFFVFRPQIFDKLRPGEEIMDAAARLAREGEMMVYPYDGFWAPMDTMKDKQDLDMLVERGNGGIPWLKHVGEQLD
jgi:glucose-1-phosphate cytidylyltransferase